MMSTAVLNQASTATQPITPPQAVPAGLPDVQHPPPGNLQTSAAMGAQSQAAQRILQRQLNLLQQQLNNNNAAGQPQQILQGQNTFHFTYRVNDGPPIQLPPGMFPAALHGPNFPGILAPHHNALHVPENAPTRQSGLPQVSTPGAENGTSVPLVPPGADDELRRSTTSGSGPFHASPRTGTPDRRPSPVLIQINPAGQTNRLPGVVVPQAPLVDNFMMAAQPAANIQAVPHPPRQTAQSLVWLLSSPDGPAALLLAPGHGYFTSLLTPSSESAQASTENTSSASGPRNQNLVDNSNRLVATRSVPAGLTPSEASSRVPPEPNVAAAAQPMHPAAPPPEQRRPAQDEEENDLFGLIIQRGWLFLRLYMFTFVLSESGTWRRYLLLAMAVIVCLMPRENPFNQLFISLRRHIDNVIGPELPPAADQRRRDDLQDRAPRIRRRRRDSRRMPTPEETAARLMQEHAQRNPDTMRDTLFRIERAVALFLASLIPGVGERHVQAREQARQQARHEEQREQARASIADNPNSPQAAISDEASTSPRDQKSKQSRSTELSPENSTAGCNSTEAPAATAKSGANETSIANDASRSDSTPN